MMGTRHEERGAWTREGRARRAPGALCYCWCMATRKRKTKPAFQVKMTLPEIEPPEWRWLLVPANIARGSIGEPSA